MKHVYAVYLQEELGAIQKRELINIRFHNAFLTREAAAERIALLRQKLFNEMVSAYGMEKVNWDNGTTTLILPNGNNMKYTYYIERLIVEEN